MMGFHVVNVNRQEGWGIYYGEMVNVFYNNEHFVNSIDEILS